MYLDAKVCAQVHQHHQLRTAQAASLTPPLHFLAGVAQAPVHAPEAILSGTDLGAATSPAPQL